VLRALVIYVGISIAFLIAYAAARPRIRLHRHRARLRAMTPDELAAEAREYAKWSGYDRSFGDSALFRQPRDWSQRSLARAIEDLYTRAAAQDLQDGHRGGPGSQVFYFYDSGLAALLEILDQRPRA
jgi:hypothetical protein